MLLLLSWLALLRLADAGRPESNWVPCTRISSMVVLVPVLTAWTDS
jgi:hypothetical protein